MSKKNSRAAARARAAQKAARAEKKAAALRAAAKETLQQEAALAASCWNKTVRSGGRRFVTPAVMEARIRALIAAKKEGMIAA